MERDGDPQGLVASEETLRLLAQRVLIPRKMGMTIETTRDGMHARLKSTGIGRFVGACFLSVWLLFWAVFEAGALTFLTIGAWALVTGEPMGSNRAQLKLGTALPAGLFLLVWLGFWTLGGLAAGRELLRLLFARDRISTDGGAIEIEHFRGLYRTRKRIEKSNIARIHRPNRDKALCVEQKTGGSFELTRLGSDAELASLEKALTDVLQRNRVEPPRSMVTGLLPKGWGEELSPERDRILIKTWAGRRKMAYVLWIVVAPAVLVSIFSLAKAVHQPSLWAMALMLTGFAGGIAWGALWLSLGRNEWKLEPGRLVLQRRFGMNRKSVMECVALELQEDNSGDGGPYFELTGLTSAARFGAAARHDWKNRKVLHRCSGNPEEARRFALWLVERCNVSFTDLTTLQAKAVEMEAMLRQLEESGRFGKWAAVLLRKAAPHSPAAEAQET